MKVTCNLSWVDERDIDVWLAEELATNAYFCDWFLARAGKAGVLLTPAFQTRVAVMDEVGRETDVEALFHKEDGSSQVLLIEDKIKAPFQLNQMEDYLDRGKRGVTAGKWHDYSVAVFAPSYRGLDLPNGVTAIRFEEAAENLADIKPYDLRLTYRADFLRRAARSTTIVSETENPFTHKWWLAVDEMTKEKFGDFFIVDRRRSPKTTYVNVKCADMPSYIRLDLKGNQGEVALAFVGFPEELLVSTIEKIGACPGKVVRKRGQDPTLLIGSLRKFHVAVGLEVIDGPVYDAYKAAQLLLSYWKNHRSVFDAAAEKRTRLS